MNKVTANFNQQTIFVGLDVDKRSWNAALFLNNQYLRNIHQPPSPPYPCASYVFSYESGKFGYWIHQQLSNKGIKCLVVNPADIPLLIKMK